MAKLRLRGRWEFSRNNGKGEVKQVLASDRKGIKEVREEYEWKTDEKVNEVTSRMKVIEDANNN